MDGDLVGARVLNSVGALVGALVGELVGAKDGDMDVGDPSMASSVALTGADAQAKHMASVPNTTSRIWEHNHSEACGGCMLEGACVQAKRVHLFLSAKS